MFNKESLFRLNSQGKPVLLAPLKGSIAGVEERPAISWGDPDRNDDWITPIYIIELILSEEDQNKGFNLNKIEIFGETRLIGGGTGSGDNSEKSCVDRLTKGSEVAIKGPLYRSDIATFGGWSDHPLTDIETDELTTVNFGNVSSHEISLGPNPELQRLPSLSIKTAKTARAILRENPIALKDSV